MFAKIFQRTGATDRDEASDQFARREDGKLYRESDIALLSRLARQAALAIEHATMYQFQEDRLKKLFLADPSGLRQRLLNILLNSIQAMPRDGSIAVLLEDDSVRPREKASGSRSVTSAPAFQPGTCRKSSIRSSQRKRPALASDFQSVMES